jgi:hypothetical protein
MSENCLSNYKIVQIYDYYIRVIVQDIKTDKKYIGLIKEYNGKEPELLSNDFKFYKAMKETNLFIDNIKDVCIIDRKEFENVYIGKKFLDEYKTMKSFSENKFLIIIYSEREVIKTYKRLNKNDIFQLYYNLLILKYNYNIDNIKLKSAYTKGIQFLKYNQPMSYLICDCLYTIENVPYKLLFDLKSTDYLITDEIFESIKDIKNDILNLDLDMIETDSSTIELYNFVYKNVNKSAIDVLLEMAKMIFGSDCKKIGDKEKKEYKELHVIAEPDLKVIACDEKKLVDLTKYIPPLDAYREREKRYPRFIQTGRPISYMIQMCKRIESKIECFKDNLFLPVIRYQSLYHPESEKKNYCGTFYYIEPESTVLLNLGRCSVFTTKVHAYIALKAKLEGKSREEILDQVFDLETFNKKRMNIDIWPKTQKILKLTNQQIKEIMIQFYIPLLHNENDVKIIPGINTTALFPTDLSDIWKITTWDVPSSQVNITIGITDDFDQDICKMARELKIDTLVLQKEIGETRAVTEILDTRENTYDNLVRVEEKKEWYKISKKYPTIWFLDNGFITNMKCKKIDIDREDVNLIKCE